MNWDYCLVVICLCDACNWQWKYSGRPGNRPGMLFVVVWFLFFKWFGCMFCNKLWITELCIPASVTALSSDWDYNPLTCFVFVNVGMHLFFISCFAFTLRLNFCFFLQVSSPPQRWNTSDIKENEAASTNHFYITVFNRVFTFQLQF